MLVSTLPSSLRDATSPDREGYFGRTHRFAPTELKLISVRYGRGGYYPPVIRETELTIPQSASLPAPFAQGSLPSGNTFFGTVKTVPYG